MKASIIIPNLNGEGWLEDSIRSCFAQTETDFEMIIIDNGSTDTSMDIIRRCARDWPLFTIIENEENTGFSYAVNQGIRVAKGEYVVLFNNDAFAEPGWLAALIETADANPKAFSVCSLMLRHATPHLADDAGDYVCILGWACKRGDGLPAQRYNQTQRVFSSCGGAALYRKSVLAEIGLFEEVFFAYLEDVDISWRANNLGYENIFCPNARCTHITSATTGSKYNDFKAKQGGRNNLLLPYKNMPLLMLVLNLPFLLIGDLIKIVFFHLRGFGKPYMQGHKEAFSAAKKVKKTPFHWRNLPNYFWVQW
ncbi:glycosyltransferase family 2 protein, partial [Ruminococcaceae bacterium OttesenSCG-928-N02]|nr:glycosyltransferase family 2 protein [Ruminococcaceae bacterium OttesenSCG-928-N02]